MKKIVSVLLLTFICTFGAKAQLSWGVRAGMNISDFTSNSEGYSKNGVTVGVVGSYTYPAQWRLQTGLSFSMKGVNGMNGFALGENLNDYLSVNLYYLELPITIGYKLPLCDHIFLIPEAGVFFAYGLGGKAEWKRSAGDGYFLASWKSFENGYLKAFNKFDSGMRFGLSVEVYKFNLSLNYDLGLVTMQHQLSRVGKIKSRTASLSLGYNF